MIGGEDIILRGYLSEERNLMGTISAVKNLTGKMFMPNEADPYKGPISFDPSDRPQIIPAGGRLTQDITINPITTYEVDNEFNGTTFIIGGI